MDRRIQDLQCALDLSDGTLLCLARGAAHDGDLASVDLLTADETEELETTLLRLLFVRRGESVIIGA